MKIGSPHFINRKVRHKSLCNLPQIMELAMVELYLNLDLPYRRILYPLSHWGSPKLKHISQVRLH